MSYITAIVSGVCLDEHILNVRAGDCCVHIYIHDDELTVAVRLYNKDEYGEYGNFRVPGFDCEDGKLVFTTRHLPEQYHAFFESCCQNISQYLNNKRAVLNVIDNNYDFWPLEKSHFHDIVFRYE